MALEGLGESPNRNPISAQNVILLFSGIFLGHFFLAPGEFYFSLN
jgi:hypothetical protein